MTAASGRGGRRGAARAGDRPTLRPAVLVPVALLLLAAATTALLLAWPGADRDGSGALRAPGELGAYDLRLGDCFSRPRGGPVRELRAGPCDFPHDAEVVGVLELPAGPWPGQGTLDDLAEARCAEHFAGYVGAEPLDSALELTWLAPTEEGWTREGDRTLTCVATSEATRTGGVQGTRL